MPLLRAAALVELLSLAALLVNLATVHVAAVASLLGPVHGCAYLLVIGATWHHTHSARTTVLAAVPVAGGLIALRRVR
ncbi:DUF3817 domain-containing protein [Dactylosporangium matsuzakiense]|uniref:DUF3817 domain-containing protein n=1 Tax=Dactylosporangium matsuzakiense TaxID=53360 RepID=A0A9W6KTP6_9ACTN|nr:DUF3817 domain-containing protein [Dactylosporangium matsuzakiense]UWZ49755.1 DUF3817 domain-containing protein [Dactylosporangium matsuzakiense]GLL07463.1 hypothetical protein GCM10017581_092150 [Dactylosporangium matsuzakiense]